MNRRHFVRDLIATTLAGKYACAQTEKPYATLMLGDEPRLPPVPSDFVGLSYESAQLANAEFFSPWNEKLVALFKQLSPQGNLRLGGGSSEYTTFEERPQAAPPPFEVFGPDTSKTVKKGTTTSRLAVENLKGFLDRCNWNCIYGLNLGQGTREAAAKEAAAVYSILGSRLVALQIGNEPDSFRNRYRPASWGPADFLAEWKQFHDAIVQAVPHACFAGPDISNKLPYLTAFAAEAHKYPNVVLLTSHYYAMGPAGSPQTTMENLLDPEPELSTLKSRDLHVIQEAQAVSGLPYRMSEGNSCWDGGKPEVSDTFASALWCADYMLACAARGWKGVNLHGGGNGYYTPIAGSSSLGFEQRPEYWGIKLAGECVGGRCISVTLKGTDPRVTAHAWEKRGARYLIVVNKSDQDLKCALPKWMSASLTMQLIAPSPHAKAGVQLLQVEGKAETTITVNRFSAHLYRITTKERQNSPYRLSE